MSRTLFLLQVGLMAPLTVIAGWAVNNLPAVDKLNLPIAPWQMLVLAVGVSLLLTILPACFQGTSSELDAQTTSLAGVSCLVPLVGSGSLFFLVQHRIVPASMEVPCLYASLGLFVIAAVLPPGLVLLRTAYSRNVASSRTPRAESLKTEQKVRKEFLDAVKAEVKDRLGTAFHNRVRLKLDKEKRPAEVQRPWDLEVKLRKVEPVLLPPETRIIDVFDQAEVGGRLLILGKPGSGKTTTLLELADALILRAQGDDDAPMPIVLSLSSWNGKVSFPEWILTQLKLKYGLRDTIGQNWINHAQFLLLLDGLDEVAPELQNACVQTLNQFQQDYPLKRLVVCSRIEEYQHLTEQLQIGRAHV